MAALATVLSAGVLLVAGHTTVLLVWNVDRLLMRSFTQDTRRLRFYQEPNCAKDIGIE